MAALSRDMRDPPDWRIQSGAAALAVAFRGPMGWLLIRLPAGCGLAYERRDSLSDLVAAWLKGGATQADPKSGVPATVPFPEIREWLMAAVMIGIDPHKASHTAVAIGPAEEPLGELRIRASAAQAGRLVAWAADWPERTWAVEG